MSKNIVITAVLALVIGGGVGYLASSGKLIDQGVQKSDSDQRKVLFYRNAMNPEVTSPVPAKDTMGMDYVAVYAEDDAPAERKPLFYRNPMNPAITSPVASKDEMGMDYIPVYPEGSAGAGLPAGTVRIDATAVQNIGVRTTKAKLASLSRNVRTIGRVTFDEQRVARLHPKYDGWIEKLLIDKTGDPVKKGSMLASIYSPQLVATQEEYILALNSVDMLKNSPFPDVRKGAISLLRSARERLELFDVPAHQIRKLRNERKIMKGMHIHSPFDGIVMNIGAREGQRITPETELYMIADLSRVWVIVDLYEDDMPWVREGDMADMKVAGIPGQIFTGKVTYIYPYLEAKTRTIKIRLEFDNPELALKPDMFANVVVKASRQVDAVVVPSEAIVRTGEHEQLFVQRAPGQFEPRKVTIGVASDGQTQIVEGVEAGEIVVTSSQFLIDSESKLKEATAKMMQLAKPKPEVAAPDMDMQGMGMDGMEMNGMKMDSQPSQNDTEPKMKEGMSMDHINMEGMK
ncbi:MAG: efflux RND transporter periplasmic adaptor subunit [Mariprofundus sp.]|nr:efflux RND transporter periplasmic adaptor subunit [Mariprofundus sp.]